MCGVEYEWRHLNTWEGVNQVANSNQGVEKSGWRLLLSLNVKHRSDSVEGACSPDCIASLIPVFSTVNTSRLTVSTHPNSVLL